MQQLPPGDQRLSLRHCRRRVVTSSKTSCAQRRSHRGIPLLLCRDLHSSTFTAFNDIFATTPLSSSNRLIFLHRPSINNVTIPCAHFLRPRKHHFPYCCLLHKGNEIFGPFLSFRICLGQRQHPSYKTTEQEKFVRKGSWDDTACCNSGT